ncbi:MAG TPA: hypothetical protein VFA26_22750, partial [Gemmataceae bacterium]|nr:hypothetical protein [Gemmataceae bacterium]
MRHLCGWGTGVLTCLVLAAAARAADPEAINRAVQLGVGYIKTLPLDDGPDPSPQTGATALVGLTLLECGVPATDPVVRGAADAVRKASVHLTHTYSLALSVLFLDRLGEEADVPIIESLTVRLLAGQTVNGGWNYNCPDVPESEARRLNTLLKQRNELSTRPRGEVAQTGDPQRAAAQRKVTDEIRQQIEVINRAAGRRPSGRDDNSNTQFAVLALWVARRHGLPTDDALAHVNTRFRGSQHGDGGWSYMYTGHSPGA